ncbi:hypothetical protein RUM43_000798 [Polyplax serrata]|uniref:Uncharacterized protein n=1 Tax=Polyplax serrata TaxID=468196 RepID=A0AAN8XR09_POLSC
MNSKGFAKCVRSQERSNPPRNLCQVTRTLQLVKTATHHMGYLGSFGRNGKFLPWILWSSYLSIYLTHTPPVGTGSEECDTNTHKIPRVISKATRATTLKDPSLGSMMSLGNATSGKTIVNSIESDNVPISLSHIRLILTYHDQN